ncbi:hypothetical protein CHELA20_51222 [Hyphomicrobiales bacterium]|nr:hypothetical protein CHELA41_23790 [Hyphomicrobiales bacterium]CAH1674543.1 hypothetical protein CHELA20_51222 [Hyphomicrobiales bacterium]
MAAETGNTRSDPARITLVGMREKTWRKRWLLTGALFNRPILITSLVTGASIIGRSPYPIIPDIRPAQ